MEETQQRDARVQSQKPKTYRVLYRNNKNGSQQVIGYNLTPEAAKELKTLAGESDSFDLKEGCLVSGIDGDIVTTHFKCLADQKAKAKELAGAEEAVESLNEEFSELHKKSVEASNRADKERDSVVANMEMNKAIDKAGDKRVELKAAEASAVTAKEEMIVADHAIKSSEFTPNVAENASVAERGKEFTKQADALLKGAEAIAKQIGARTEKAAAKSLTDATVAAEKIINAAKEAAADIRVNAEAAASAAKEVANLAENSMSPRADEDQGQG